MTKVKRRKANKVVSILTTCTFLYLFIAMFVFSAINSSANIEVEDLQKEIKEQKLVNESYKQKIDQLTGAENMEVVEAKEGLEYNNNNVIVIHE